MTIGQIMAALDSHFIRHGGFYVDYIVDTRQARLRFARPEQDPIDCAGIEVPEGVTDPADLVAILEQ